VALIVVDASVVIAFRTPADTHHDRAVAAFARYRRADVVLPASAYAEILVEPAASGTRAVKRAKRVLQAFPMHVEPITQEIAERAAILRARLRLPDALVVATADVLDADAVLTADRRWSTVSRRVQVV
jgi:predicted nucleic acid-binding protein